ncbi:MAG: NAD-dependent epimerase/dehydratase family protein [Planctomycetes bacterium]|nr:NAD-dependent epimerase/dehydratase family protein [Planctomycetota bacterium]MCC7399406.1 NAD-dependent epimerase/dehydratase family protein [Planctomycetota bacterium]
MPNRSDPTVSRRSFLASAAAGAALCAVPGSAAAPRPAGKHILVLGGTSFLGPAIVDAGLARGHRFTLFNRGKTNPGLYAGKDGVEQIQGQRRRPRPDRPKDPAQDLKALEGRRWDAVVDTSAYFTGEVEDVCKVLTGNVGQFVFISSLSVYQTLEVDNTPVDEQSPLCACEDKYTHDMGKSYERYGALKRYCEEAAAAAFPDHATLVRPGYIVGPGDPTDRFTYWPQRFSRGGECLAPGDPDNELQFVDVRDLGAWIVHLIEHGITGPFNAVGFDGRISTAEFLHTGKGTLNHTLDYTWVDDAFLAANQVEPWGTIGCWTPTAKNGRADNRRAVANGATFRPIAETIRDTAAWVQHGRGDKPWPEIMLTAARERELLALWKQRAGR